MSWFLCMVQDKCSISFFCMWISSFPNTIFFEETVISILWNDMTLLTLLLIVNWLYMTLLLIVNWLHMCGIYFWALFCFIGLYFVFMLIEYCFNYCYFVIYFEIRKCDAYSFVLYQDCFGHSGCFVVLHKFYNCIFPFL